MLFVKICPCIVLIFVSLISRGDLGLYLVVPQEGRKSYIASQIMLQDIVRETKVILRRNGSHLEPNTRLELQGNLTTTIKIKKIICLYIFLQHLWTVTHTFVKYIRYI